MKYYLVVISLSFAAFFFAAGAANAQGRAVAPARPANVYPVAGAQRPPAPLPGTIPPGPHYVYPSGALGGAFASTGISRPLGGVMVGGPGRAIPPGVHRQRLSGNRSGVIASYVPNYYGTPYYGTSYYGTPEYGTPAAAYAPVEAPETPVIINQYFNSPPPGPSAEPGQTAQTSVKPGDPLSAPENFYLIAYRNHAIYAALAYWVEDGTLHYVTTQNEHNQASLKLIDLELTTKLNQDRSVPFSIDGR